MEQCRKQIEDTFRNFSNRLLLSLNKDITNSNHHFNSYNNSYMRDKTTDWFFVENNNRMGGDGSLYASAYYSSGLKMSMGNLEIIFSMSLNAQPRISSEKEAHEYIETMENMSLEEFFSKTLVHKSYSVTNKGKNVFNGKIVKKIKLEDFLSFMDKVYKNVIVLNDVLDTFTSLQKDFKK